MKAVLDTNVLVSAFVTPQSRLAPLWIAAREQRYKLVVSPQIMRETARIFRTKFAWHEKTIIPKMKLLVQVGELVVPQFEVDFVSRDPDDNRILECAVAGKVDAIVSGDGHLLTLQAYQSIPIMRPLDFLRALGS